MQYHLNGVRPGDPGLKKKFEPNADNDICDVLIVGTGPAGLTLAAQLSAFPEVSVRVIEKKSGPLQFGQADGLACRSLEMFEAFGFADKVMKEAYWVNEVTFWRPAGDDQTIQRADRIKDVEDDLSEMPHVILSQARVHDFYLEQIERSASPITVEYDRELIAIEDPDANGAQMAIVKCLDVDDRQDRIKARYIVGCDGARSQVRRHMGLDLKGEAARQLWGVMDILCVTDFPDIRLKCAIQSASEGSLLIIPREGGYLARMYIELDALGEEERAADRKVTKDYLITKAKAILSPYSLDVKEVSWWSAYEIGQRLTERFDNGSDGNEPNIFIAGDACHTHSPKAGQGMNVSMADAFNLGWKLALVIKGEADPVLLRSYSQERHAMAKELIDFDRDMARLFSKKPQTPEEIDGFQRYFQKHGRYTAGVETRYAPSRLIMGGDNQHLATGLKAGMRFHSAPVIRAADAKRMQLGHCLKADGRWRLFFFLPHDDAYAIATHVAKLVEETLLTPLKTQDQSEDPDSLIDARIIFQCSHKDLQIDQVSELFLPKKGRHGLIDYEKIFCPDLAKGPDIFDKRGIDRDTGALILIRPDQYIAGILPPSEAQKMALFFEGIFGRARFTE